MQLIFCPDLEVDLKSRPHEVSKRPFLLRFPAFEVGLYGARVEPVLPAQIVWVSFTVFYFSICSWWFQIGAFLEYHDPLLLPTPDVII